MSNFQDAKAVVLAYHAALETAQPQDVAAILGQHTSPEWHWRGMHPFYEQTGAANVANVFWAPLLTSLTSLQRREDIFFAGQSDGAIWVASMGHLMGLFDRPFLGIPPTGKIAMLRYAEFHRIENGQIVETAQFCDLIHLMHQAGLQPLPPQTGAHLIQPGPRTHDGLLRAAQDPAAGADTLDLINRMIGDIAANSNSGPGAISRDPTPQEELKRCWSDQMLWWGPDGIGATYTIDR